MAVPVIVCGMKLAQWARENGVNEDTAYRWFHAGVLPVPARQLPTGTILVDATPAVSGAAGAGTVALYARVSSADQRADLDRQLGRLAS
jgi:putative resolvase